MKEYKLLGGQLIESEVVTETKTTYYDIEFLQRQTTKLRAELIRLDALIAKHTTLTAAGVV